MKKKSKTIKKNLFLFTISVVVSIVILEIALRAILPSPIIWKHPQEQYIYDPEIGHWLKPNQHAFTHNKTVHINSIGIRDKEYSGQSQNNVYRILALGDSQTFGNGLELGDTWPKQLERILDENSNNPQFEVINSGLPGSDTWQHEIILERMISQYNPNAVVLAFYVNDVQTRFKPTKNAAETNNDLTRRITYILKRSTLLLSMRAAVESIRESISPSNANVQQRKLLSGSNSPPLDRNWQQVESSLSKMKAACDRKQIRFLVASLPRRDQVYGQQPWKGYQQRLKTIASRYNIPLISVFEPLREQHNTYGDKLFIPWDGHNSPLANDIIAKTIADTLSKTN